MTVIAPLVAAAYLIACLLIGLSSGRGQSASTAAFVAGDRSLGLLVMYFITGATVFSAFAFLGLPGWAYGRGAAAFYILGYGALGFIPFYFLGPRAARLGRVRGYVTQAELVAARFETPALAGVMALVSVVAFIPYLALQIKGAGLVLQTITAGAIPEWLGGLVVYGMVLTYVLRSGVLGVGWTNTFQGIFMIILAWGLGLYLPWALHGGVEAMFRGIAEERPEMLLAPGLTSDGNAWSWSEYSSAVVVSVVGFSAWPHLFMKAYTAKSVRTLRRSVVLYPTFQIFLVPIFLIGFAGVGIEPPPARPDGILPHLLVSLELNPVVVGLFCAGALAASMSSGDAMVHAAASIAVRDGWVTALGRPLAPRAELLAIRVAIVVLMVAAYALAVVYQSSLVPLLLYAYGPILQFMPGLVAALFWRRATGTGVLLGLVAGAAVATFFVVRPDLRPWAIHAGLYGLGANLVGLVVGTYLTSPPPGALEDLRIARSGVRAPPERAGGSAP